MATHILDVNASRRAFPALSGEPYIFADNAGGSQCLGSVPAAITDYLLKTNVQLGADYSVSVQSTGRVGEGLEAARELFNAAHKNEVVLGSSSTQVCENLARALEPDVQDGDELIVTTEHEANSGPWKKLAARRGANIKTWRPTPTHSENPFSLALQLSDLLPLITSKTRVVAFTACSNILGSTVPVAEFTAAIRKRAAEVGARKVEVCIDCVAYAPHRRIDVRAWDIDYCFFSFYKVYGAHFAALYLRTAALKGLTSIAHHFLPASEPGSESSYKIQGPSGPLYELGYSGTAVLAYLRGLTPAGTLDAAFDAISAHETTLSTPLLQFLAAPEQHARGVRIVGAGAESVGPHREPTISFVVRSADRPLASRAVVAHFDKAGRVGIRFGHFYAYTLVKEALDANGGGDVEDGVVRISLVHYNTVEEVEAIIKLLKEALA